MTPVAGASRQYFLKTFDPVFARKVLTPLWVFFDAKVVAVHRDSTARVGTGLLCVTYLCHGNGIFLYLR